MAADPVASVLSLLVAYGHLLIGLSLLSALMVRLSSIFGIAAMVFYWMAHMDSPYISATTNFIVDEHMVYAAAAEAERAQEAAAAERAAEQKEREKAKRDRRYAARKNRK